MTYLPCNKSRNGGSELTHQTGGGGGAAKKDKTIKAQLPDSPDKFGEDIQRNKCIIISQHKMMINSLCCKLFVVAVSNVLLL